MNSYKADNIRSSLCVWISDYKGHFYCICWLLIDHAYACYKGAEILGAAQYIHKCLPKLPDAEIRSSIVRFKKNPWWIHSPLYCRNPVLRRLSINSIVCIKLPQHSSVISSPIHCLFVSKNLIASLKTVFWCWKLGSTTFALSLSLSPFLSQFQEIKNACWV